jgi:pyridoxal 5'-phosphate synthase pdxS subunit
MATELPVVNSNGTSGDVDKISFTVKSGLARMLQGGVIMDVVNAEQVCSSPLPSGWNRANALQARIAEEAGAVAVMALERVPADIRVQGGVARMSDPQMIKEIMEAVTIPVMAKARIGHFVECQVRACPPPRAVSYHGYNLYKSVRRRLPNCSVDFRSYWGGLH